MHSRHPSNEKDIRITRRSLLGGAAALGAGGLAAGIASARPRSAEASPRVSGRRHLVWVWQFSSDGAPNVLGATLRDNDLGMVLKTHDGVEWMSKYDKSPFAVSGPPQVEVLASYYEDAGVPFHAWAVIKGENPLKEAQMAAAVLAAGARSIYLDLEPHSGFWQGTPQDAVTFGNELRRLQPNGWVVASIDPRPWVLERLPMAQFAAFSNEIAPQLYWRTYNTSANYEKYAAKGIAVGPEGITPEFLVNTVYPALAGYNLPITPVGQGNTDDLNEWRRFIGGAYAAGSFLVGVWRYGVAGNGLFPLLRDTPPREPPPPPQPQTQTYTVQPGDTLGKIAAQFGVSVDDIMAANGLDDPNYLYVGQQLTIPGGSAPVASAAPVAQDVSVDAGAPADAGAGGGSADAVYYTVESGDTLYAIAVRFGTSVDALVALNGLSDPNVLQVGQVLRIS